MQNKLKWMSHPDHGISPFYDRKTIEDAKKEGWKPCEKPKNGPIRRAAKAANVLAPAAE